jgi:hypothetical protein
MDQSPGGNYSSPSCTPLHEHTLMSKTIQCTTTFISTSFVVANVRQQRHQHGMVCLTRRITRLENEVQHAMAVMDTDTGKLLNCRQLMRSTKYRQAWSLSLANEFGRLANGIGGRIKNLTNTIKFIFQHKVPRERMKDVTYGQFVCTVRPHKAEPN